MTYACEHNPNVVCSVKTCQICGWNPAVAKARLDAILEKMGVEPDEREDNASETDS